MKRIYLQSENNYYPQGTNVKAYFEGKTYRGKLWDEHNEHFSIIQIKLEDGAFRWFHNSLVTLVNSQKNNEQQNK